MSWPPGLQIYTRRRNRKGSQHNQLIFISSKHFLLQEENCHPIATPITRLPSDMVFSPDLRQVEGSPLETKFLDLSVSPMEDTVLTGGVLHSDLLKVEPISTADAR